MKQSNSKKILGLSCFYHDSAASLTINGEIICAVQEERFSRKKHDSAFPVLSIKHILEDNKLTINDIDLVVYYEKPLLTFERLLETYLAVSPRGIRSFISAMKVWIKEKLFLKSNLKKLLINLQEDSSNIENKKFPKLLFSEHHLSHAASAFYPSPFKDAAILCMDGVGEWATTSGWIGREKKISPLWEINFPHSIGLLYSAFTYYCGFKVNSGEYKLMGLAPYGEPKYTQLIKDNLIDIKEDGSFRLNMSFFKYHRGFRMTSTKFERLFKTPARKRESKLTQFHMDLASSIQKITEEIVIALAKSLRKESGSKNLCLSGGVALNCVANGKLISENIFENIWVQPASGDAGSSLGASLLGYYDYLKNERTVNVNDSMKGTYLGPSFSNDEIIEFLSTTEAKYQSLEDNKLLPLIANLLNDGKVIGWFNGRLEFGPRALGGRSIIGDPRNKEMQSIMNLKIKYRESFRPFAPSILKEDISNQFELNQESPYMLIVAPVKKNICIKESKEEENLFGIERLKVNRSTIPAVTHIDYSARIQTVDRNTNKRYYDLINEFKKLTGCPLIVNTSFNVRGEPIVCTPEEAYKCFLRTEMDVLVLENQLLLKNEQPVFDKDNKWQNEFELD